MKDILAKLNKIQSELKAPKGQFNSFGKYKYRSTEDILEAVKPLLSKYNCVLTIGDCVNMFSDRFYVEATAVLYDCESGELIKNSASAREELDKKGMDSSQITGTASSYARKYALNGLLAIDDTKDSDATNTHGNDPQADVPAPLKANPDEKVTKAHIDFIKNTLKAKNRELEGLLAYMESEYKITITKLEDMTLSEFMIVKGVLDKKGK